MTSTQRPRTATRQFCLIFVLANCTLWAALPLKAQVAPSIFNQVLGELNQRQYRQAEATLKSALSSNPHDATALGLMGVILDAQKRYAEAESFYERAIRLAPRSASLYNNFGNHYLAEGKASLARDAYLKVVKIDAHDQNANLQLAQIYIARRQGNDALHCLAQLSGEDQHTPEVCLLKARALKLTGNTPGAEQQLAEALEKSKNDPRAAFSAGLLFAKWKRYSEAEGAFSKALRAEPTNFDILYNLGLSALGARDPARAERVFESALKQRPKDVGSLLGLARVEDGQGDEVQGLTILYRAERLAPENPDVLRLMAGVTQKIGLNQDSISAYDKLLKLQPENRIARRDRGFVLGRAGQFTEAAKELSSYVRQNPSDPVGFYDLALAESLRQKDRAVKHLTEALVLNPRMAAARLERAVLLRQEDKFNDAIDDLKLVLQSRPESARALGELGETYLASGKVRESLNPLQKASRLAPHNSLILLHYSQALMRAGEQAQARAVLAQFRDIEANKRRLLTDATTDLPASSASEPSPRTATTLERLVAANPANVHLKIELGKQLLSEGKTADALNLFRHVKASALDAASLDACGRALLNSKQFNAASQFLKAAMVANPASIPARLDLAIAVYHEEGAEEALAGLRKIPPAKREGDYFLLQAQLLDSSGRSEEAAESLNRAFQASPTRPDLYFQAALFLIKHNQPQQVIRLLAQADRIISYSPKLWLTRAIGFGMLRRQKQALAILSQIEMRSPGWYLPYEIQGIILSIHFQPTKAKAALQMAIALGADDSQVYFYLASAILAANAEDVGASQAARDKAFSEAQTAVDKALALDSKDPYTQSLAGKVAYLKKDYPAALQHLNDAVALWPNMVGAHETLSATYRALGEKNKSIAQLKTVLRIKQRSPTADQIPPFPMRKLLFSVR